jgi:hypothetical protein
MASSIPDPTNEILARFIMLDREREAVQLALVRAARRPDAGLRPRFAARLARLALVIDREAASAAALPPCRPLEQNGA